MRNTVSWRVISGTLVVAASACGGDTGPGALPEEPGTPSASPTSAPASAGGPTGWEQLPAPPLSGRVGALLATVGDTIIVAGGWDYACPPGANCVPPASPP